MALYLDVGPDDVLRIGDTLVAVERKSGSRARLKIVGKSEVELLRKTRGQLDEKTPFPGRNPVAQNTGD